MTVSGNLKKMLTQFGEPVQYWLELGGEKIDMNAQLGKTLSWNYEGRINCKVCGRKTKKSFAQGFCYPCFMNAPENSPCIINPEQCEGHEGGGRDPEWEIKHHVKPHVVYLAVSSGIKVGVTRHDQVPTRWIDQGASWVIKLAETPYRRIAGDIEVSLKAHMSDKTNWQRMLKNQLNTEIDLLAEKARVHDLMQEEHKQYLSANDDIWELNYPVQQFPEKVKSINMDKIPQGEGKLVGIKGQYLIFEDMRVMNVRKHTSYWVEWEIS